MKRTSIIAAVVLALSAPAHAQSPIPFKLVVLRGTDGIAMADYPSAARCEAAKEAILQLVARENQDKQVQRLPNGGMIIPKILRLEAFCIPG